MIDKGDRRLDIKRSARECLIEVLRSKCSRVLERSIREYRTQIIINNYINKHLSLRFIVSSSVINSYY